MVVFRISARSSLYIQERCVSDTKSSIKSCYTPDANVEYLGTKPLQDFSKSGLIALSEKPSSKISSVRCQRMRINDSQTLSTIIVSGCCWSLFVCLFSAVHFSNRIGRTASFKLGKKILIPMRNRTSTLGYDPPGIFSLSYSRDKTKNLSLFS